ncbi:unnamed protein product [Haemonchus placei]|uniref:Uncharacterized protein n=1 Tax=Haemonchus placei TaxID=6290 RepID=A0A0N4VY98_HAEPC|nr:unnamed protein product [Haemonchus placei]
MVQLPADAPSPRLCIVEKNSPDQVFIFHFLFPSRLFVSCF